MVTDPFNSNLWKEHGFMEKGTRGQVGLYSYWKDWKRPRDGHFIGAVGIGLAGRGRAHQGGGRR